MTEHDDRLPMHQMLEHAREAVEMIRERTRAELQTNRMLQLALVHLVQTVGEAATRVSAAGRVRYSEANHFPPLVAALERVLAGEPD
jgi:uncharacterized protein with HEPN domain